MSKSKKRRPKKRNEVLMHYLCRRYTNKTTGRVEVDYVNVGGQWYGFANGYKTRIRTARFLSARLAPMLGWDAVRKAYPNCKVTQFIVRQ